MARTASSHQAVQRANEAPPGAAGDAGAGGGGWAIAAPDGAADEAGAMPAKGAPAAEKAKKARAKKAEAEKAQPKRRPPAKKPQARAKKAEPKPKQPAGAAAAPGAAGQGAIAAGEVTGSGAGSAQTATHVPPAMGPGSTAGGDGSGPGTTYGANQTAILHAQHEAQLAAARARAGQSGMGGVMPAYPQGVQPVQSVPSIDGAFHGSLVEHEELDRLVKRIDKRYTLEAEVKEALLEIADDFTETVTNFACMLAAHRRSDTLEPKDLMVHLERNWHIKVPGFSSDESTRPFVAPNVSQRHKQRSAFVKKSIAASTAAEAQAEKKRALEASGANPNAPDWLPPESKTGPTLHRVVGQKAKNVPSKDTRAPKLLKS